MSAGALPARPVDLSATQEVELGVEYARFEYLRTLRDARENARAAVAALRGRVITNEELDRFLTKGGAL